MTFIVATNVIASRPTGTPHARANIVFNLINYCDLNLAHLKVSASPLSLQDFHSCLQYQKSTDLNISTKYDPHLPYYNFIYSIPAQRRRGHSLTAAPRAKSKMADGVWKGVYPQICWRSQQLSQNKFLDPSTPSMRKVDDREKRKEKRKEKKKEKIMTFIVATNVIGSRPPERRPT